MRTVRMEENIPCSRNGMQNPPQFFYFCTRQRNAVRPPKISPILLAAHVATWEPSLSCDIKFVFRYWSSSLAIAIANAEAQYFLLMSDLHPAPGCSRVVLGFSVSRCVIGDLLNKIRWGRWYANTNTFISSECMLIMKGAMTSFPVAAESLPPRHLYQ